MGEWDVAEETAISIGYYPDMVRNLESVTMSNCGTNRLVARVTVKATVAYFAGNKSLAWQEIRYSKGTIAICNATVARKVPPHCKITIVKFGILL